LPDESGIDQINEETNLMIRMLYLHIY